MCVFNWSGLCNIYICIVEVDLLWDEGEVYVMKFVVNGIMVIFKWYLGCFYIFMYLGVLLQKRQWDEDSIYVFKVVYGLWK